jgi:phosphatidylglycerol lysyltransferase
LTLPNSRATVADAMNSDLAKPDLPRRSGAAPLLRLIGPGLAIAAGIVLLLVTHRLARGFDYRSLVRDLGTMPPASLWRSAAATGVSFLALIARDWCALRYAEVRVPAAALLLAGFCGSALGNAVGFGALTGGAVRYRIYGGVGVRPEQIGRIMGFITAGFALGLAGFAAASALFALAPVAQILHWPVRDLRLASWACLMVVAAIVAAAAIRRRPIGTARFSIAVPRPGLLLLQTALTGLDLIGAAAALWVLLPAASVGLADFSAIFAAATALGVVSHVPGGAGVFEAVILYALGHRVSPNHAAAALLVYRVIYFGLPLALSAVLLAGAELARAGSVLRNAGRLAPMFLSTITFAIGTMLLVSGATPAFSHRLALLHGLLPLWVVEAAHFLGSIAGVALLFVARGLFHRLDGAWWLGLAIALASLVLALAKGMAYGEAAVILGLILLLLASRRHFARRASLFRQAFTPGWFAAVAIVLAASGWIVFFAFRDVAYAHEMWWQFEFDAQAPRSLRALLGAVLAAAAAALWQLLRPAPGKVSPPDAVTLERAAAIIRAHGPAAAMIGLMGDKSFLFSASGLALLMYGKRGRSWVALFDPIGPRAEWAELIWRFIELADEHGGRAAFYQVRSETLPLYLDAGLKIMKLGEEARLDLKDFELGGGARSGLRYALKRGERDGLALVILPRDQVPAHLPVLAANSDAWLARRRAREKGFSVAAFVPAYLARQDVALLSRNGKPVAFASLMTLDPSPGETPQLLREACIGIMRHTDDASPYAMEFLFTRLALDLKAQGFAALNLGMAPLAGLGRGPLTSYWHRIAGLLWQHGGRVYNFQGLRSFKSKFLPEWEPRYLAATGTIGPFLALADVAALAGGAPKAGAA